MKAELNIFRSPVTAVMLAGLGACSASGGPYAGNHLTAANPERDTARVVFLRTGESVQYSLRRATITIDDTKVGALARKGFLVFDLPPGQTPVAASMWDLPGACTLVLDLQAGETTYIKVGPRPESLGASTAGAVVGSLVTGGHPAGEVAGMAAGGAIEAGQTDCGGAFSLQILEPEAAASQLVGLKESR